MRTRELAKLRRQGPPLTVRFIESSCGPMVIQVCFIRDGKDVRKLLKDSDGDVVTCSNLAQAYAVCISAGVREAELVQMIPQDEACAGTGNAAATASLPLTF